ncbi:MAG: Arm DNA-binding domain-containing protein [Myxococcales bacterium]|jgi:hypothetical protein|nr:Arm DNA-binding domain-containing protein [Myxococcales bacterium]
MRKFPCTIKGASIPEFSDGLETTPSPDGCGNSQPQNSSPPLQRSRWGRAFLLVNPSGGRSRTLHIGSYPDVSLKRARELLAEARTHVAEGRDPCALKQAAKAARKLDALDRINASFSEFVIVTIAPSLTSIRACLTHWLSTESRGPNPPARPCKPSALPPIPDALLRL